MSVPPGVGPVLVTAAAGILAWQALLNAYTFMPAIRSARSLVATVRPYVHPGTEVFSVGQYRQTIAPYLGRTLRVVDYVGELELGFDDQPDLQNMSDSNFETDWRASHDAVGFFEPGVWARYQSAGLPGRVVAADAYTVAVVQP
jgi:hypothetical protein